MAELQTKPEPGPAPVEAKPAHPPLAEVAPPNDVVEKKAVVPPPEPKPDESKALAVVESEFSSFFCFFMFVF